MNTALTLATERRPDGTLVLAVTGEIDMSNAATFAAALADTRRDTDSGTLTVDLTQVEYIDSAGLAILFPYAEHLRLIASPLLATLLRVVGLDDVTTIREQTQ